MRGCTDRPARRLALTAVAVSLAAYACATGHASRASSDEAPHPVYVEVHNDLPMSGPVSVYLLELPAYRRPLGDVSGSTVKTFSFKPAGFGEPSYRLIAYRPLSRPIFSAEFNIESPVTGAVIWSVYSGIVSFRERATADTAYINSTRGPIQVGGAAGQDSTAAKGDSTAKKP